MLSSFIGKLATKLIILSLGLIFLLPPAFKLYSYLVFRYHAISVDGIVVDSSRGRDLGSRPIVEYRDLQGRSYQRKSKAKTHWFYAAKVGEKMKVFYDVRNPNTAIVDSKFHYVLLPLFFIAVGCCFLFYVFRDQFLLLDRKE